MTNDFTTNVSTAQPQDFDKQVKSAIDNSITQQIIEMQKLIAQIPKLDSFDSALLSVKASQLAKEIEKKLSEQITKSPNLSSVDKA